MRTMRWITPGLLLPLMLALVIMPANAADTLDQSQTVSQSPATVSASSQQAQIFTAGMYGWLDRISLYLENWVASPPAGAVLTVSVQTVVGGLPSGKQIGSGTVSLSAIGPVGSASWVDVNIRGAIMHPGVQYALVLQTTPWNAAVTWWLAYNTSYAGGVKLFNDGTSWRVDDGYDFTFRTYVVPDVVDQSQNSTNFRMGVLNRWTLGQTFTAGVSGVLDRVRVPLGNLDATGPIQASIETVTSAGYPSGTVIGQGSIPASSLPAWPAGPSWVTIDISDAVVSAGTKYALILREGSGQINWYMSPDDVYEGGDLVGNEGFAWVKTYLAGHTGAADGAFETYIVRSLASTTSPPPGKNTQCYSGVCPSAGALISPPDSSARITSLVQLWEKPDGRIEGILHFDDSRTGNLVLKGCSTNSAACRLTVTRFACTAEHAISILGTYTPKGEEVGGYRLTLSGVKGEVGNFTLNTGNYTYTLTHKGIADVTCPPAVEAAGLR